MGSSSAVGVADKKVLRIGRRKDVDVYRMKDFRSVLEMAPILEWDVSPRRASNNEDWRLTGSGRRRNSRISLNSLGGCGIWGTIR